MSEEQAVGYDISHYRECVERAGAQWLGIQQSLDNKPEVILFRDPVTQSTCGLFKMACRSVDDVQAALRRKREQFAQSRGDL